MSMQISFVAMFNAFAFCSLNVCLLLASVTNSWLTFQCNNYKTLGAEKSGKNAEGDSWWEKWKEVLYQDERR